MYLELCTVTLLLYLMVLKNISPGCGVPASLMLFFSYDKDIWIVATDDYMHFYIIVLFPLTVILQ